MVAETDFDVSLAAVAVTLIDPPEGIVAGAVYFVAEPLAVVALLRLPQSALLQLTVHFTPPPAESLLVVAAID